MSQPDEADKEAERLLPCHAISCGAEVRSGHGGHYATCPAYYRRIVAAALRAKDGEIERLREAMNADVKSFSVSLERYQAELAAANQALGSAQIKLRAADVMAKVADDWVKRKVIDARSGLADARLDYGDPYKFEAKENQALKEARERIQEQDEQMDRADKHTEWIMGHLTSAEEILGEVKTTLRHAKIFIVSREKMHAAGVGLYEELQQKIEKWLAAQEAPK